MKHTKAEQLEMAMIKSQQNLTKAIFIFWT